MKERAIFLVGTFGSGKDIILKNVLEKHHIQEFTLEQVKSALTTKLTKNDKKNAVLRKESIIISTNSSNYTDIKIIKETLEEFGYETSMVFVDANKQVLLDRIKKRDNFDLELFESKINKSKRNKYKLKKLFKYYAEYDNSFEKLSSDGISTIEFFVEEFLNNSFKNLIEEKVIRPKKEYSLKKKLVGSLGDKILGSGSKISADSISQDYSVRNSGIGYPSTVGAFYGESYAADVDTNMSAFSALDRQTPPTEYYSNQVSSENKKHKRNVQLLKKLAKEKDDVDKT